MDAIAERRIDILYPDGSAVPARIRIGAPYPHPLGDWACPVQAEGLRLGQGSRDICGVDSFQALMLAVRYLRHLLVIEVENGAVLHWEGGAEILDIDGLFEGNAHRPT